MGESLVKEREIWCDFLLPDVVLICFNIWFMFSFIHFLIQVEDKA